MEKQKKIMTDDFLQLRKYIKSQIQETINTKQDGYKEPHHAHHSRNAEAKEKKKINLNQQKNGRDHITVKKKKKETTIIF